MEIIRGLNIERDSLRSVATVGSYDGLHIGHRELIERVKQEAKRVCGRSMVITFDPHPRLAIDPEADIKLLTTTHEKCQLLEEAGIQRLVIIPFDREFSLTPPREFISSIVKSLNIASLIVGYDHRFGHDKEGDFSSLKQWSEELNLNVIQIQEQELDSRHVSSTVIRRLICNGEMGLANQMLCHNYILHGDIDDRMNFVPRSINKLLPKVGVYDIAIEGHKCGVEISNSGKLHIDSNINLNPGEYTLEFI